MSLNEKISTMVTEVGTDIKAIRTSFGKVSDLTSTSKLSLVAAIDELETKVSDIGSMTDALIQDTQIATDSSFSSTKVVSLLGTLKTEILGGVEASKDTLAEIETLLLANDAQIQILLTAINQKVSFAAKQVLTVEQQTQAQANLGLGTTEDFLAIYTTAVTEPL